MQSQNSASALKVSSSIWKFERISTRKESDVKAGGNVEMIVKTEQSKNTEIEIGHIEFVEANDDVDLDIPTSEISQKYSEKKQSSGPGKGNKKENTPTEKSLDTGKCSKKVQSIDTQRIPRSTKRVTPDSKSTISCKDIVMNKKQKAEKLMVKMDFNKSSKDSKCSDVGNREESYKRSRTNQISDQKSLQLVFKAKISLGKFTMMMERTFLQGFHIVNKMKKKEKLLMARQKQRDKVEKTPKEKEVGIRKKKTS